jgi:hypothetical protein
MSVEDIVEVVLFHCPNSKACQLLVRRMGDISPPFDIISCNLSTEKARGKVLGKKIDIKSVPTLMIVFSDDTAEFFYGVTKILAYLSQFVEDEEYEEEPVDQEVVILPNKKHVTSQEEGEDKSEAFDRKGKTIGINPKMADANPGKDKFKDLMANAKKMQQQMHETYGYDTQKGSDA